MFIELWRSIFVSREGWKFKMDHKWSSIIIYGKWAGFEEKKLSAHITQKRNPLVEETY